MPNAPKTPARNVRVPDEVWFPAMAKARAEGSSVSAEIVAFLERYVAGSSSKGGRR